MPPKSPIESPAKYATSFAIGFADPAGDLALVAADAPLPVTVAANVVVVPPPLTGTTSGATVAGPFAAATDKPIHLLLNGEWEGEVSLLRSIDGGATRLGLTAAGMRWASFTGNVNEPVWQDSADDATFYLDINLGSGTLNYRVSQ